MAPGVLDLNDHAEPVGQAADQRRRLLGAPGNAGASDLDRFVDQGRAVTTRILDQIHHSFVTPFDRSDIKEMTSSMQSPPEDMQSSTSSPPSCSDWPWRRRWARASSTSTRSDPSVLFGAPAQRPAPADALTRDSRFALAYDAALPPFSPS